MVSFFPFSDVAIFGIFGWFVRLKRLAWNKSVMAHDLLILATKRRRIKVWVIDAFCCIFHVFFIEIHGPGPLGIIE